MASDLEFFAAELKKYNVAVQKIYLAYDERGVNVDKNALDAILHGLERWHNAMKSALFSIESNSNVDIAYRTVIVESDLAITQLTHTHRNITVDGKREVFVVIENILARAKRRRVPPPPLPPLPRPSSVDFTALLQALKRMDLVSTQTILATQNPRIRAAVPQAIARDLLHNREQSPTPMYWTLINAYLQIPLPLGRELLPQLGILCERDRVEPNLAKIIGSTSAQRLHIRRTLEVLNYYDGQVGVRCDPIDNNGGPSNQRMKTVLNRFHAERLANFTGDANEIRFLMLLYLDQQMRDGLALSMEAILEVALVHSELCCGKVDPTSNLLVDLWWIPPIDTHYPFDIERQEEEDKRQYAEERTFVIADLLSRQLVDESAIQFEPDSVYYDYTINVLDNANKWEEFEVEHASATMGKFVAHYLWRGFRDLTIEQYVHKLQNVIGDEKLIAHLWFHTQWRKTGNSHQDLDEFPTSELRTFFLHVLFVGALDPARVFEVYDKDSRVENIAMLDDGVPVLTTLRNFSGIDFPKFPVTDAMYAWWTIALRLQTAKCLIAVDPYFSGDLSDSTKDEITIEKIANRLRTRRLDRDIPDEGRFLWDIVIKFLRTVKVEERTEAHNLQDFSRDSQELAEVSGRQIERGMFDLARTRSVKTSTITAGTIRSLVVAATGKLGSIFVAGMSGIGEAAELLHESGFTFDNTTRSFRVLAPVRLSVKLLEVLVPLTLRATLKIGEATFKLLQLSVTQAVQGVARLKVESLGNAPDSFDADHTGDHIQRGLTDSIAWRVKHDSRARSLPDWFGDWFKPKGRGMVRVKTPARISASQDFEQDGDEMIVPLDACEWLIFGLPPRIIKTTPGVAGVVEVAEAQQSSQMDRETIASQNRAIAQLVLDTIDALQQHGILSEKDAREAKLVSERYHAQLRAIHNGEFVIIAEVDIPGIVFTRITILAVSVQIIVMLLWAVFSARTAIEMTTDYDNAVAAMVDYLTANLGGGVLEWFGQAVAPISRETFRRVIEGLDILQSSGGAITSSEIGQMMNVEENTLSWFQAGEAIMRLNNPEWDMLRNQVLVAREQMKAWWWITAQFSLYRTLAYGSSITWTITAILQQAYRAWRRHRRRRRIRGPGH